MGVLTQLGFLAQYDIPVRRGLAVRKRLLCLNVADPPDDVPPLDGADPNLTTREKFAQHTEDPTCAACHALLDPIGFGFEHFDEHGVWRDTEAGKPVDASGELVGAGAAGGEFDGVRELSEQLDAGPRVGMCASRNWFQRAFNQHPRSDDLCHLDELAEAANGNIVDIFVGLTTTDFFRYIKANDE